MARLRGCGSRVERHRFAVSRGTLRHLLSLYTGLPATGVALTTGELGKPLLNPDRGLHFSVSHSQDTLVVALARSDVGVDVEHPREPARMERIARRIMHRDTCALLAGLAGAERAEAFLDAWTLREAHVKAVGGGLFRTADALPFVHREAMDGVPRPRRDRQGAAEWSVARFLPAAGLRATLVVRGTIDSLRVHDPDTTHSLLMEKSA